MTPFRYFTRNLSTCASPRVQLPCSADKSSIYLDPSAEAERLISSNHVFYGFPEQKSFLVDANQTWGDLRRTAFTRPSPAPKFFPPSRDNSPGISTAPSTFGWVWPERQKRLPAPSISRCAPAEYAHNVCPMFPSLHHLRGDSYCNLTTLRAISACCTSCHKLFPNLSSRPQQQPQTFLEEYELRPPWLKY